VPEPLTCLRLSACALSPVLSVVWLHCCSVHRKSANGQGIERVGKIFSVRICAEGFLSQLHANSAKQLFPTIYHLISEIVGLNGLPIACERYCQGMGAGVVAATPEYALKGYSKPIAIACVQQAAGRKPSQQSGAGSHAHAHAHAHAHGQQQGGQQQHPPAKGNGSPVEGKTGARGESDEGFAVGVVPPIGQQSSAHSTSAAGAPRESADDIPRGMDKAVLSGSAEGRALAGGVGLGSAARSPLMAVAVAAVGSVAADSGKDSCQPIALPAGFALSSADGGGGHAHAHAHSHAHVHGHGHGHHVHAMHAHAHLPAGIMSNSDDSAAGSAAPLPTADELARAAARHSHGPSHHSHSHGRSDDCGGNDSAQPIRPPPSK
jgi:hypothetical protein